MILFIHFSISYHTIHTQTQTTPFTKYYLTNYSLPKLHIPYHIHPLLSNTYFYYSYTYMEFTQIHQISSLSPLHKSIYPPLVSYHSPSTILSFNTQSSPHNLPGSQPIHNSHQINIQHINQSKQSIFKSNISQQIEHKNIRSTNSTQQKDLENQSIYKKYDRSKSTIFNNSLSTNRSIRSPTIDQNIIKVFYFNSPILKLIPYTKSLTVRQLIQKSLEIYLMQINDTVKATQSVTRFEMRLPISENDFSPDMTIDPIHEDRVLSQNMFGTLVLCEKEKKDFALESKPTKEYSCEESSMEHSREFRTETKSRDTIRFILLDETYYELMRVDLDREGNLIKLFELIQENNLNNEKEFVIKDDIDSEFDLSPDHEVKLIEKNRLYLMTKKYLDEAEDDLPGPIRLKTLIQEEINYLPPIGINEASRYEQFQVTKISSVGIAIDRILGIDQTKIYNYQKELRQQKRQASIMDKFLGLNNITGTKRPFRFIKQIKQINKFPGGIQVIYPDKTTTFIIKDETILQKIYRKLSFLVDLNKISNPKQKIKFGEDQSPKKSLSFFKF